MQRTPNTGSTGAVVAVAVAAGGRWQVVVLLHVAHVVVFAVKTGQQNKRRRTCRSSTSNTRSALGGMDSPAPSAPYLFDVQHANTHAHAHTHTHTHTYKGTHRHTQAHIGTRGTISKHPYTDTLTHITQRHARLKSSTAQSQQCFLSTTHVHDNDINGVVASVVVSSVNSCWETCP